MSSGEHAGGTHPADCQDSHFASEANVAACNDALIVITALSSCRLVLGWVFSVAFWDQSSKQKYLYFGKTYQPSSVLLKHLSRTTVTWTTGISPVRAYPYHLKVGRKTKSSFSWWCQWCPTCSLQGWLWEKACVTSWKYLFWCLQHLSQLCSCDRHQQLSLWCF